SPGRRRRRATKERGTSSSATPTPRSYGTRCAASSPESASSWWSRNERNGEATVRTTTANERRAAERRQAMNVVMLSPGYPAEMAYFTRALSAVGATGIGVGDQPPSELPAAARDSLAP